MSIDAERHVLAVLAGPIAGAMYTGGDHAARYHGWTVAMHEAAHAALATALGIRLEALSIIPARGTLGHCHYRSDRPPTPDPVVRSDESVAVCMVWLSHECPDWRETRRICAAYVTSPRSTRSTASPRLSAPDTN